MSESTPVTDALTAQGDHLPPGTPGWWQIYGARAGDIRAGDLVMVKPEGDPVTEHAIAEIVPEDGMLGAMYVRFLDAAGADIRIGQLCPVIVLRQGTHATLAESI